MSLSSFAAALCAALALPLGALDLRGGVRVEDEPVTAGGEQREAHTYGELAPEGQLGEHGRVGGRSHQYFTFAESSNLNSSWCDTPSTIFCPGSSFTSPK